MSQSLNLCYRTAVAAILMFATWGNSLLADTTFFENGFYFITAPAEFDDVIVGEGAVVAFTDDVLIAGDLRVIDGGFASLNYCVVEGDVKADGAAIVDLLGVTVGGDVSIKRTGGDAVLGLLPLISIIVCDIEGNVKIINNDVRSITVTDNLIGGNLLLRANDADSTTVSGNQTNLNRHCRRK